MSSKLSSAPSLAGADVIGAAVRVTDAWEQLNDN
jgi:hypothetical protein